MSEVVSGMSLGELARRGGLPGRTIRFYIARGLLPAPHKAGRGASYGPEHLERLEVIQGLQKQGLTLGQIGHRLAGAVAVPTLEQAGQGERVSGDAPAPEGWMHYRVAEDVVVQVRTGASPWRVRVIRNELARLAAALRASATEDKP